MVARTVEKNYKETIQNDMRRMQRNGECSKRKVTFSSLSSYEKRNWDRLGRWA